MLSLLALAAAANAALSADECAVFRREASFAASVETHDAKAFAAHLHAGAVFSAGTDAPVRGREAVAAAWKDVVAGDGLSLRWRPRYVNIGGDPNVAISRGPYVLADKDKAGAPRWRIGDFTSVWVRKDASSPWLVLFDGGGPAPALASESEASAHLGSAPETCGGAVKE